MKSSTTILKKCYLASGIVMLVLTSCVAPIALFETEAPEDMQDHIGNFYATSIFEDQISKELWFSPDGGCLDVSTTNDKVYSGSGALHITWDKGKGGCDWIGMGIGWENWSGKNLGSIYDQAALSFKVRTDGRTLKTLPVAIAFEDHGNLQAWTGFSRKMLESGEITGEWSTVTIPILSFNWSQFEADISNIKQMIIQFEASGDIYMDEVRIIEHQGSLRSRVEVPRYSDELEDEAVFKAMNSRKTAMHVEGHSVQLGLNGDKLFVSADVIDETPLQNKNVGDKVWNGDAIEIAMSSDAESSPLRSYFLSTDHQIGIRATEESYAWNWRKNSEVISARVVTTRTSEGYHLEAIIHLAELGVEAYEEGAIYGLELAIDTGDASGRKEQIRWNAPDVGGFHENPSLWGEMKIVAPN